MRVYEASPDAEVWDGWDTTGEGNEGLLPPEQQGPSDPPEE